MSMTPTKNHKIFWRQHTLKIAAKRAARLGLGVLE